MVLAWLHGMVLAFGLILPLGVQNIFIFNQGAAHKKFTRALPSIITASICDTILTLLAVLGVSMLLWKIVWLKTALVVVGACFLLYLGYMTWRSTTNAANVTIHASFTWQKQVMFAASVSLLNPHAIMDTIGVIGTSSTAYTGNEKVAFTVACILISWMWFLSLAWAGRMLGKVDNTGRIMLVINKLAAILIWLASAYLIYSGLSS
ncbi:LysE/ArgO family amino acid transporter [Brevibacillus laterosporus]|uniref:LysE/ArgO family amino acid transporter n=1 Tax=Brevibacillus laterosporus TaxID=1465 RepID=UPI002650D0A5|nr:LysE family transporter [Brevibacillus laterosporus]MDN9012780.1 LysE family transporter [Brevibacillus laterosporus]MDO0943864.1 LysE family transporter [Brevibacillus laterosporus]